MVFKIEWTESKNKDWKIATVTDMANVTTQEVSINRTGKKGDVFPGFDEIMPGKNVEGELWVSQTGKAYLFPPKVWSKGPGASRTNAIKQAVVEKQEGIKAAQENKELGIKTSSTIRMAVDLAIACKEDFQNIPEMKVNIREWRNWLIAEWDNIDSAAPFND